MGAKPKKNVEAVPSLMGAFDCYQGPVLRLDPDARVNALNDPGREIAEILNGETELVMLPSLVQLAVKARTEGRARSRTFSIPGTDRQIEFILLPQEDGSQLMIGRDATLEVNIRTALAESRGRFKDLVEVAADFAWETDLDGRFSYISGAGALGYAPEEVLGKSAGMLFLDAGGAPTRSPFETETTIHNVEVWVATRQGNDACIVVSAMPVFDSDGRRIGARGIGIDITEQRLRQGELAALKTRDRLVAYIVDALRNEVTPSEMLHAAASALGRSTSSASCTIQVTGATGETLELANYGAPIDPEILDSVIMPMHDVHEATVGRIGRSKYLGIATGYRGLTNGAVLLWRAEDQPDFVEEDRTLLKALEPQFGIVFRQIADQHVLERLSRTDELTGVFNRRAFMDDLTREMTRYERYDDGGALLFVDLDNFKPVNDSLGHEKGDEVLQAVASILAKGTRTYDLVCRLGGDEFAAWIESADRDIAAARAERFITAFKDWRDQNLAGNTDLGMSVGIAMFRAGRNETVESLIAKADAAMYDAKHSGKNRTAFASDGAQDE